MKFRKKPVIVEAVQLTWNTWSEIREHADVGSLIDGRPQGCYVDLEGKATESLCDTSRIGLHIPSLEGLMLAVQGDWIIKGVKGELYLCKPHIFEATYEKVET